MEIKRRPFTLSGGIVNIIFGALDILATILIIFMIAEYSSQTTLDTTYLAVFMSTCAFEFVFAIVIIILSSVMLAKSSLPVDQFNRYTGLIITLFVFDCIAVVGSLINSINGNYFSIVTLIIYAMCATFIMVDLCLNKKELKKNVSSTEKESTSVEKVVEKKEEKENLSSEKKTIVEKNNKEYSSTSKLYQILVELKEMKDNEIITADEYKKLKEKLTDKYEF